MLILKLFQHIRVGGITGLGLLHRWKAKLFKQEFSKLLGGLDIKRRFRVREDQSFAIRNPLREHLAEILQLLPVDGDTFLFHSVKHTAQGQFHLFI